MFSKYNAIFLTIVLVVGTISTTIPQSFAQSPHDITDTILAGLLDHEDDLLLMDSQSKIQYLESTISNLLQEINSAVQAEISLLCQISQNPPAIINCPNIL